MCGHIAISIASSSLSGHISISGCPSLPLFGDTFLNSSWSKTPVSRWNFDVVCHSAKDISISGLGGHIAISGYPSLSQSFGDTSFELAVVENVDFII